MYPVVVIAYIDDLEATLNCLKQWREGWKEVKKELGAPGVFTAAGLLFGKDTSRSVMLALCVGEVLSPADSRKLIQLHLCGESGAGIEMCTCMRVWLSSTDAM